MNLPSEPGLERRLAYSEYIRSRNRRNRSRDVLENFIQIDNYNSLNIIGRSFSNNIKNGLSLFDLINRSQIYLVQNSKFECPICQDNDKMHNSYVIRQLDCNHKFHIDCIETWLSNAVTCPICRKDLSIN